MSLRPAAPVPPGYPRRLVRNVLLAATVTATSLGGCGPIVDEPTMDAAVDAGDLDATVTPAPDPPPQR